MFIRRELTVFMVVVLPSHGDEIKCMSGVVRSTASAPNIMFPLFFVVS